MDKKEDMEDYYLDNFKDINYFKNQQSTDFDMYNDDPSCYIQEVPPAKILESPFHSPESKNRGNVQSNTSTMADNSFDNIASTSCANGIEAFNNISNEHELSTSLLEVNKNDAVPNSVQVDAGITINNEAFDISINKAGTTSLLEVLKSDAVPYVQVKLSTNKDSFSTSNIDLLNKPVSSLSIDIPEKSTEQLVVEESDMLEVEQEDSSNSEEQSKAPFVLKESDMLEVEQEDSSNSDEISNAQYVEESDMYEVEQEDSSSSDEQSNAQFVVGVSDMLEVVQEDSSVDINEQCNAKCIVEESDMSEVVQEDSSDMDFDEPITNNQVISIINKLSIHSINQIEYVPNGTLATDKEVGVLGIGQMGSIFVKNLLDTGHLITVWDRTSDKYTKFLEDEAEAAESPSKVVKMCDIILCLVDADEMEEVVFGVDGLLEGFRKYKNPQSPKGFVLLTSMGAVISKKINASISEEGVKYLEVFISGSIELAQKQSLTLICAGDAALFHDCYTCFASTAANAFYLGERAIRAYKMDLVLGRMTEATNVALQEAISQVSLKNLPIAAFMEFMCNGPLKCNALLKKVALLNS